MTPERKQKQLEDLTAFKSLSTYTTVEEWAKANKEIREFIDARIPLVIGEMYFNPIHYTMSSSPLFKCLRKTQRRHLFEMDRQLWKESKKGYWLSWVQPLSSGSAAFVREMEDFRYRINIAHGAFIEMNHSEQWAKSRYDIELYAICFRRNQRYIKSHGSQNYEWKRVKSKRFIIVDAVTGLEAPLLPGAQPHKV